MRFIPFLFLAYLSPIDSFLHPLVRRCRDRVNYGLPETRLSSRDDVRHSDDGKDASDSDLLLACEWSPTYGTDNERRTLDGERIYYRNGEYDSEADLWISLEGPPMPNFYDMTLPMTTVCEDHALQPEKEREMVVDADGYAWRSDRMLDSSGLVRNEQVSTEKLWEQQRLGEDVVDLPVPWHGPMELPPENRALSQDLKLFDKDGPWRGTLLDDERWMVYYSKLAAFQTRFGQVDVPIDWEEDPMLGNWVLRQRHNYRRYVQNNYYPYDVLPNGGLGAKNNQLTPWRIQMLYDIGFSFKILLSWEDRFRQLELYHQQHGNCQVQCSDFLDVSEEEFPGLYVWSQVQRTELRKGGMDSARHQRLLELDFDFDPLDSAWRARMGQLRDYYNHHGHIVITKQQHEELAGFIVSMRKQYRLFQLSELRSQLTQQRIDDLNDLGMDWAPIQTRWQKKLESLRTYAIENGDCLVPYDFAPDSSLAIWVKKQRTLKKVGKLPPEQEAQLVDISFVFDVYADSFERGIVKLEAYKASHGDSLVPTAYSDQDLVMFVKNQRNQHRALMRGETSSLTTERKDRLKVMGFLWKVELTSWEDNYSRLVRFFDELGHTDVPSDYIDSQLYAFVRKQREFYKAFVAGKSSPMTSERVAELEALGFCWNTNDARWKERYKELVDFKSRNGHCKVPDKYHENTQLASWVRNQRNQFKKYHTGEKSTLTEARIEALVGIDFEWSLRAPRTTKRREILSR
jgi:hypothetical protein